MSKAGRKKNRSGQSRAKRAIAAFFVVYLSLGYASFFVDQVFPVFSWSLFTFIPGATGTDHALVVRSVDGVDVKLVAIGDDVISDTDNPQAFETRSLMRTITRRDWTPAPDALNADLEALAELRVAVGDDVIFDTDNPQAFETRRLIRTITRRDWTSAPEELNATLEDFVELRVGMADSVVFDVLRRSFNKIDRYQHGMYRKTDTVATLVYRRSQ